MSAYQKTRPETRAIVLVVDDEPANLGTFRRMFRDHCEVSLASSGAEAIALVRTRRFDCALVDYAMPEMNGVELLKHLADLRPEMARALLTAHFDRADVLDARTSGLASALFQKPWLPEQILAWVKSAQGTGEGEP
jgi:CheY-like chemotaxis protein